MVGLIAGAGNCVAWNGRDLYVSKASSGCSFGLGDVGDASADDDGGAGL